MMGSSIARRVVLVTALLAVAYLANGCTTAYDYDPSTAGETEGTKELRAKTSSQFLRGAFADLLGRAPERYDFIVKVNGTEAFRFQVDEELQISGVLDGLGDSLPLRNLVVNGMLHSAEVNLPEKTAVSDSKQYIRDQFRKLLGREPNAYELAVFAAEWDKDPAVGPRTIIRAIMGSREYQAQ